MLEAILEGSVSNVPVSEGVGNSASLDAKALLSSIDKDCCFVAVPQRAHLALDRESKPIE